MAKNKITIDADFAPFMRGIGRASNALRQFGNSKVSMGIDKKTIDAIDIIAKRSSGWKSFRQGFNIKDLKTYNDQLKKTQTDLREIQKLEKEASKQGFSPINSKVKEKEKLLKLEKQHSQEIKNQIASYRRGNFLQRKGAEFQARGTQRGGIMGGAQDMMGGVMSGVGTAMGAMGPAAWALGAGIGMYGLARAISAPRRQMAGANIKMMGLNRNKMGGQDLANIQDVGTSLGYGPQEMMQSAMMLQRGVGNVGNTSAYEFARTKRMTGLEDSDLAPILESMREAAVGPVGVDLTANIKKTQDMYAQAMISALDSSGAIRFMETTANMTESISREGTADIQGIQDLLSQFSLSSDFYKANAKRTEAVIKGAEDFYKSDEGTGIAMMAMTKSSKFKNAGPGEMLLAQKMGFLQEGFSAGKFSYKGVGTEGLGLTVESLSEAMGLSKKDYAKSGRSERGLVGTGLANRFGIGAESAMKLLDLVMTDQLKNQSPSKIKKLMEKESEVQGEKTNTLLGSIDANILQNEAKLEKVILSIGEKILPVMTTIEGGVLDIADHLLGRKSEKSIRTLESEFKDASKRQSLFVPVSERTGIEKDFSELRESKAARTARETRKKVMSDADLTGIAKRYMGVTSESYGSLDKGELYKHQMDLKTGLDALKNFEKVNQAAPGASAEEIAETKRISEANAKDINKFKTILDMLENMAKNQKKIETPPWMK